MLALAITQNNLPSHIIKEKQRKPLSETRKTEKTVFLTTNLTNLTNIRKKTLRFALTRSEVIALRARR